MSVGFIGLGNIGKPIARQLLKLGEPVLVYDVAQPRLLPLALADRVRIRLTRGAGLSGEKGRER